MSQETPVNGSDLTQTDLAGRTEQVNKLLRELEGIVSVDQHAALTEFFAEWAVLSAMRTTLKMQARNQESSPTDMETEKGE